MLIFTLSFFQPQQEKFRVELVELSKNFHLFMSCDRPTMFVLHVDTFKARATIQYNIYFAIYNIYRWKKKMKKIDDRK